MASPFTVFRKNQTVVMAGLVIVAIIAFVVAPILTQYMNNSYQAGIDGANGQRNLVVRWRGGKIDSGYASALVQTNRNCQALLMRVAEDVIKNGGSPKVPGFRPNGPNQGFELGFTSNNPLDVIRTKLLAERARELGIEFDDSAVDSYIRAFADGRVSNQRFKELMKEQNRLSQFELYRFLKDEFAKEVIMRLAMSGIADGSMPMITPGQSWQLFLRFQQRARIEAFPVLVDDYLSKVTATPSDADLKALYEEGKKRYPNKMFPEPGFQRRYEANIEFVSGNLEAFIDAEKKKLTEEQISQLITNELLLVVTRFQTSLPRPTLELQEPTVQPREVLLLKLPKRPPPQPPNQLPPMRLRNRRPSNRLTAVTHRHLRPAAELLRVLINRP